MKPTILTNGLLENKFVATTTLQMIKLFSVTFALIAFLIVPVSALAQESFFDVFYDATAVVQITLTSKALPRTEVVRLKGHVVIRNFRVGDLDGDGKPDIRTEIIELNLSGKNPQGMAVNLNSSKSNRSIGMTEQLIRSSRLPIGIGGTNFPANSFFDIFTELSIGQPPSSPGIASSSFDVFINEDPIHLEGVARSLTDLGGFYTQRKSVSIIFHNDQTEGTLTAQGGDSAGKIKITAVNLNSSKSN